MGRLLHLLDSPLFCTRVRAPGPLPEVQIKLNPYLTFRYENRRAMSVIFGHEGVASSFDVSVKLRRYDSYLAHSHPILGSGGKLSVDCPFKTLVERAKEFSDQMQVRVLTHQAIRACAWADRLILTWTWGC